MLFMSGLTAVLIKEFTQLFRDRLTLGILFGLPILELLLFGFAINSDVRQVPTAVIDFSRSSLSRNFLGSLQVSDYFRVTEVTSSLDTAERMMKAGGVMIIVTIPPDFERRALEGQTPDILIEADMSDPNAVNGALSMLESISRDSLAAKTATNTTQQIPDDIKFNLILQKRFNAESITRYNYLPGLQGVILEMCMLTMVGLSFTRETERGTIEALLSLPLNPGAIILGKTMTYVAVGFIQSVSILILIRYVFSVPFEGSFMVVAGACAIFAMASVSLGYLLATLARTQMQVMNIVVFYFLISTQLTGFMFPFAGMPQWAQWIGELLPLTHFMRIVRAVMLKGASAAELSLEFGTLLLFITGFGAVAAYRFRRTLD